MRSIYRILERTAEKHPHKNALIKSTDRNSGLDYRELLAYVDDICCLLLKSSKSRKDKVAILSNNSFFWAASLFSASKAGLVAVPLDPGAPVDIIIKWIEHCGSSIVLLGENIDPGIFRALGRKQTLILIRERDIIRGENKVEEVIAGYNDEAVIIYTTGSAGAPAGVILTNKNIISNVRSVVSFQKINKADTGLCVLPFFYIYGLSFLLTHVYAGAALVIENRFLYPQVVVRTMTAFKVSVFAGVPTHYSMMLKCDGFDGKELPGIRMLMQAGDRMPVYLTGDLVSRFPSKRIYLMYGMTEASPRISYLAAHKSKNRYNSVGRPIKGVTVKIIRTNSKKKPKNLAGEIAVKGDNVMKGYLRDRGMTRKAKRNGWLMTGDIGYFDKDGYLYIIGRKSNIIKVKGKKVDLNVLEVFAIKELRAKEAAAIVVNNKFGLKEIHLYISFPKKRRLNIKDVLNAYEESFLKHQVPQEIRILSSLPKNRYLKTDKERLVNI